MTERDIYRALGTQRDPRLGEWLSRSITEYSQNFFPDEFYHELLHILCLTKEPMLVALFGEDWTNKTLCKI